MEIKRLISIEMELKQVLGDLDVQMAQLEELRNDFREVFVQMREEDGTHEI